jgi:Ca2+-binding RTX toxin-like protein
MALHKIFGFGPNLINSNRTYVPLLDRLLYGVPTEFGVDNGDGTRTYYSGTGLTYDWATGSITGGTINTIKHFGADGNLIDTATGEIPFSLIMRFLTEDSATLLQGDDIIDARIRAGGAIGNDVIDAGAGNDIVYAGSGDDTVRAGFGNDTVFLDDGNDSAVGDYGNDIIRGGNGNDGISGGFGFDTIYGDAGADSLMGDDGDDLIYGGADNDTLDGGRNKDSLYGQSGNDRIDGGSGSDRLDGGSGDDLLIGGVAGSDTLIGGTGNDTLIGDLASIWSATTGRDTLLGGDGNDVMTGGSNNDKISGGAGVDTATYALSTFADLVITRTGTDFIIKSGFEGTDTLTSVERIQTRDGAYAFNAVIGTWEKQPDIVTGQSGILTGTGGDNKYTFDGQNLGGPKPALVLGLGGNDTIIFNNMSANEVSISHGNVAVLGGDGNDNISAGRVELGSFHFDGGAGDDRLIGGNLDDSLSGGSGSDVLEGGGGDDLLTGGAGGDTFQLRKVFDSFSSFGSRYFKSAGDDVITDFQVGIDHLSIGDWVNISINQATDGLKVTWQTTSILPINSSVGTGPLLTSTVVLLGVQGNYTIDDLLAL